MLGWFPAHWFYSEYESQETNSLLPRISQEDLSFGYF